MRAINSGQLLANLSAGPIYTQENGPNSYLTVQTNWWLSTAGTPNGTDGAISSVSADQLPYRWFMAQNFSHSQETAIPNIKNITMNDQLGDVATLTVEILNIDTTTYTGGPTNTTLGTPGAMSFTYGSMPDNTTYFNQTISKWTNVLREGALIRWYFGYGGKNLSFTDALTAGNVVLKGLWSVDSVIPDASSGLITLNCRCLPGKLLQDQLLYPDLVPAATYSSSGINFIPPMCLTYDKSTYWGAPGQTTPVVTQKTADGYWCSIIDGLPAPNGSGYLLVGTSGRTFGYSGQVYGYGGIALTGSNGINSLPAPIAGADSVGNANVGAIGYFLCDQLGDVFPLGGATVPTSSSGQPASTSILNGIGVKYALPGTNAPKLGQHLHSIGVPIVTGPVINPIIGFRVTTSGGGYWMCAEDGTIYNFGNAPAMSVPGAVGPIVSFAVTPDGTGCWLLALNGTVYASLGTSTYGNYTGGGTAAAIEGHADSNGVANGYWIVGNDNPVGSGNGHLQNFGGAPAVGLKGGPTGGGPTTSGGPISFSGLRSPISSIRRTASGNGLWAFGMDGGVFTFGDADFFGSLPAEYSLWVASNYVSPYNTNVYVPLNGNPPPAGITVQLPHGVGGGTVLDYAKAPQLLAPDYMEIVRTIWNWSGGYYPARGAYPTATTTAIAYQDSTGPPPMNGVIFDSGAYNCQPIGTRVSVVAAPKHGYPGPRIPVETKPIEEVQVGDRVLSLNCWKEDGKKQRSMLRRTQRVVSARQMDFDGELVQIKTSDGFTSSYTPNHRCMIHIGDALQDKYIVYLMRKGSQYRVGRTGCRNSGMGGVVQRLAQEKGNDIWILSVHETLRLAALMEMQVAYQFNLPTALFQEQPDCRRTFMYDIEEYWRFVGDNTEQATYCLEFFGRDIQYPFFSAGGSRHDMGLHRQRACNLLNGMKVLTVGDPRGTYFMPLRKGSTITIERVPYSGPVFSLEIEEDHNYIADGVITSNSLGPIDSSTFDKVSAYQAIQSLAQSVSYIMRWSDNGGLIVVMPNIYAIGNYMDNQSYAHQGAGSVIQFNNSGTSPVNTGFVTNPNGVIFLQGYTLTSTDSDLRSEILVTAVDPAQYHGTPPFPNLKDAPPGISKTVTKLIPAAGVLNLLHGIQKVAMLGLPLNVPISPGDQDLMAEMQLLLIWLASRTGTLIAPFDPRVTTDSQIQVIEQITGETNCQWVVGLSVVHNLDTGDCLCTYTLQWLGGLGNDKAQTLWGINFPQSTAQPSYLGTTSSGAYADTGSINNSAYDANGNLQSNNTFPASQALAAAVAAWQVGNHALALPYV